MMCLRDERTGRILGLSYTVDGLKWTANKTGRLLFYQNAKIKPVDGGVAITGDTRPSKRVVVEPYIRKKHRSAFENNFEEFWSCKAKRMATYY